MAVYKGVVCNDEAGVYEGFVNVVYTKGDRKVAVRQTLGLYRSAVAAAQAHDLARIKLDAFQRKDLNFHHMRYTEVLRSVEDMGFSEFVARLRAKRHRVMCEPCTPPAHERARVHRAEKQSPLFRTKSGYMPPFLRGVTEAEPWMLVESQPPGVPDVVHFESEPLPPLFEPWEYAGDTWGGRLVAGTTGVGSTAGMDAMAMDAIVSL